MITDSELSGTDLMASTHKLDNRLQAWVDKKRVDIEAFARSHICDEACENTISLWASEVIIHHIDAKQQELDEITDASLSAAEIEHCHSNCLTELQEAADATIRAEEA
jgi:hypothetical protein